MTDTEAGTYNAKAPTLYLTMAMQDAISLLCSKNTAEWTLFGKTEYNAEHKIFQLVDVYLPKQENTQAHTEVEEDAIFEMIEDLSNRGEDLSNWNLWIHSHNTMGAFWSGTDYAQMDTFGNMDMPFMFSLVVSYRENKMVYLAHCSQYKPFPIDGKMNVLLGTRAISTEKYEQLQKELDEKTIKKPSTWERGDNKYFSNLRTDKKDLKDDDDDDDTDGWEYSPLKLEKFQKDKIHGFLEEAGFKGVDKNKRIIEWVDRAGYYHFTGQTSSFFKRIRKIYKKDAELPEKLLKLTRIR